jgi:hypothetical protein
MIIAIERNTFNYLYKYNQVKISLNQLIDATAEDLSTKSKIKDLLAQFDRALPLFEEDHEVLLLEVNKTDLEFDGNILLQFKAVKGVYPLTIIGKRLLLGKLNDNIIIYEAVFETLIEELKIKRSLDYRKLAVKKLHLAFGVKTSISVPDFAIIEGSVYNILKGATQDSNQYIRELIDFNKTPSYIPDGNIEYLLKIGLIAIKSMGRDESVLEKGPYYKKSVEISRFINSGTLAESYTKFLAINDDEFKKSLNGILNQISINNKNVDIFKLSYYYIAFKNILLKKDCNLLELGSAINQLIKEDESVASWVLTLVGYSFSFEKLYESLHKLDPDQLYNMPKPEVLVTKAKELNAPVKNPNLKLNKKNEEKQSRLFSDGGNSDGKSKVEANEKDSKTFNKEFKPATDLPKEIPIRYNENDIPLIETGKQFITTEIPGEAKHFESELNLESPKAIEGVDIDKEEIYDQHLDAVKIDLLKIANVLSQKKKNKKVGESLLEVFENNPTITFRDLVEFLEMHGKNIDPETINNLQRLFKG